MWQSPFQQQPCQLPRNYSECFNPRDYAAKSTVELENYHAKLSNWIASSINGEKGKPWNPQGAFEARMLERREGLARIIAGRRVVESLKEKDPPSQVTSELVWLKRPPTTSPESSATPLPTKISLPLRAGEDSASPPQLSTLSSVVRPLVPKNHPWEDRPGMMTLEKIRETIEMGKRLREEEQVKDHVGECNTTGPPISKRLKTKENSASGTTPPSSEDEDTRDGLTIISEEY